MLLTIVIFKIKKKNFLQIIHATHVAHKYSLK